MDEILVTILVRDGTNTQRTITAIQVRDGTNTARDISEMWVRDSNNVPRRVFGGSPLSASASPADVSGFSIGTGIVDTGSTTVTPTGGTAPYTYAWTIISYTAGAPPTIANPTAATTDFTQTGVGDTDYAVFRCTVTDDASATFAVDVNATFLNITI